MYSLAPLSFQLSSTLPTAARAMVQVVRRIEPDAKRHAAYRPFYEAYKETYEALAGTLHRQVAASG